MFTAWLWHTVARMLVPEDLGSAVYAFGGESYDPYTYHNDMSALHLSPGAGSGTGGEL